MKKFLITEQQAQTILTAIGELPVKVGLAAALILTRELQPSDADAIGTSPSLEVQTEG